MKAVHKLVVLLVGVFLAVAASAVTAESAYLESCRREPGVPVPVTVVAPSVGAEHEGSTVQLEFVVDAQGMPADFSFRSATDPELAAAVVLAVKKWRFQPAESNGVPVATKVLLPIRIVDPLESGLKFAVNR